MAVADIVGGKQTLRCIAFALHLLLLTGCSQYTRDLFWENKIVPTPFEQTKYIVKPELWRDDAITYSWLGHATVLINFYGTTILTDPVLLERIGPPEIFDNLFGIKRLTQLPLDAEQLTGIDLVLISHPHFDHLDLASLRQLQLKNNYTLIVPALTKDLLENESIEATELDWFSRAEKTMQVNGLDITAFRVEHYGYADWGERDVKRGFNGYLVTAVNKDTRKNSSIAFFGDTSYSRYRNETGDVIDKPLTVNWREKFDPAILKQGIDLCIIPIGDAYYYWNHISPKNAVRLAHELNCKKMLPVHYSTFLLTPAEHEPVKPKQQLLKVLGNTDDGGLVRCRSIYESTEFPDIGLTCKLQ